MKDYEFLEAVGGIEARFIENADRKRIRRGWKAVLPLAACVALVAGAALALPKSAPTQAPVPAPDPEIAQLPERGEAPEILPEPAILHPGDTGYDEPTPEPMPEPTVDPTLQDQHGAFLPCQPVNGPASVEQLPNETVKPSVSWYEAPAIPADLAVENGGVFYSDALTAAMEHYGDETTYRVLVEVFRDGMQLSVGTPEVSADGSRLSALGYTVAWETVTQEDRSGETVTVHAEYYYTLLFVTLDQLEHFPPSEDLGYCLRLYGEVFGGSETPEPVVFNGSSPTD